jgi:adenine deaminase
MAQSFSVTGNLVDVHTKSIYTAEVVVSDGKIAAINKLTTHDSRLTSGYILPGFIDSHVHVESSMLVPSEFAKLAVVHGTVGTVSDPHEIANVCGMAGVEFMIDNGKQVNFKFNFGAPSCVPATTFETAGAALDSADVHALLLKDEIKYLSEMMNFPGVLFNDEEVMKKIASAKALGKPIDGHAPGLRGEDARKYIAPPPPKGGSWKAYYEQYVAPNMNDSKNTFETTQLVSETNILGDISNQFSSKNDLEPAQPAFEIPPLGGGGAAIISTDHECFTKEEALDKLGYGMKIIIREGSAAKNFEALIDLLNDYPNEILFCSDDKHPDSLMVGHINQLCARAVAKGIDIFNILQAACVNPVLHYKLDIGLLRVGDDADFIIADDLVNFNISHTYINGELVAQNGQSFIQSVAVTPINQFDCDAITAEQLAISTNNYPITDGKIPVIEALEGQLITNKLMYDVQCVMNDVPVENTSNSVRLTSNIETDILKMVVVNRYHNAPIAKAFIKNVGLKQGAIASSVAHDSHNIVAVGVDDESLAQAINLVIQEKGGVSAVGTQGQHVLGLPVAGLMSANDGYQVAATYTAIDAFVKEQLGSTLAAPFMTLSFMALLVIPHLKLSDKGLFDGDSFQFV